MYPLGSPCLYGGYEGYILVTMDGVAPGLGFNSQPHAYAKWIFEHEEELQWHSPSAQIVQKIEEVVAKHPALKKCIVRATDGKDSSDTANESERPLRYAWFNVYSIPGWGERFKEDEQVKCDVANKCFQ